LLARATVLRGIHTTKILRLSEDLPIVVEIVDRADRIEKILPLLDEMVWEGLIMLENIRVIKYRHGDGDSGER
jgi:uncharacterized protein